MILDLLEDAGVLGEHKIDGGSLSSETTGTPDSVNVVLFLGRNFVVDNQTNLLNVDTTCKQVCRNEHANGSLAELAHHNLTLALLHLSVHRRHNEVLRSHRLFELLNALLSVAVDEGLVDVEIGVEIEEHLNFPLLLLDGNVVLVDTF